MAQKTIITQARVHGAVVFDSTIPGKKNLRQQMLAAMSAVDAVGGPGEIRQQVLGARAWVNYRYDAGASYAERDQSIGWQDQSSSPHKSDA